MPARSLHAPPQSRRRSNLPAQQPGTTTGGGPDIAALELLEAQRIVCRALVQSCERALVALRLELGSAKTPTDVRVGLEAAELLEAILADWRDTSAQLAGES